MPPLSRLRSRFFRRPAVRRRAAAAPSAALESRVLLAGVVGEPLETPPYGPNDGVPEGAFSGPADGDADTELTPGEEETPTTGDPFAADGDPFAPSGPSDSGGGSAGSGGSTPGDGPGTGGGPDPGNGGGTESDAGGGFLDDFFDGGYSGDDPLGDAIGDYVDGYLDQAAANAEAVEEFFDELGDWIADEAAATGDPALAGAGAAVDSLLDDLGGFAGDYADPIGGAIDDFNGARDVYDEAGGGLDGLGAVANDALGVDDIAAGISGYDQDGNPLTPTEQAGALADGIGQAAGTLLGVLTPFSPKGPGGPGGGKGGPGAGGNNGGGNSGAGGGADAGNTGGGTSPDGAAGGMNGDGTDDLGGVQGNAGGNPGPNPGGNPGPNPGNPNAPVADPDVPLTPTRDRDRDGDGALSDEGFTPQEQETVDFLRDQGNEVGKNPDEGVAGKGRQGDAFVNGEKTEIKNPNPAASPDRLSDNMIDSVRDSISGGGQAPNIVIDGRGAGVSYGTADRTLRRLAGNPQVAGSGKLDSVTIITEDGEVLVHKFN